MTRRPRVVIAGMGDTGLLVAIHLARHADVVGISDKNGLVSGQELGLRLARPREWERDYRVGFDRFRRLDRVRTVHARLTELDVEARVVRMQTVDGRAHEEPYDVLVIATGVSNGFWRRPALESDAEVTAGIAAAHARVATATSVMIIGGGAAAVSSAWNIAMAWPDKKVDLCFPGDRALVHHHPRVWDTLSRRLEANGVGLHPGHRATIPSDFRGDELTSEAVAWSSGQPDRTADVVLWAIGRVRPNTGWVPPAYLDEQGFVRVDEQLRVPGLPGGYAVGDVAATDPLRTSARGRADRLLARNIRADLGRGQARRFKPRTRRWGSVVGAQRDRLEVFDPKGRAWTIAGWSVLQPWVVRRAIYKGIRPKPSERN